MVALITISLCISILVTFILVRSTGKHARAYSKSLPQRFHAGDVSRLGGIGIVAGSAAGWATAVLSAPSQFNVLLDWRMVGLLGIALAPAVLGGIFEDMTQRVSVRLRLLMTFLTAGLACTLLTLRVSGIGIGWVDALFVAAPWAGIAIAILAIGGLPHAFNIIDGYNGLCAAVALLVYLAIGHVALQLGDRALAALVLCLAGATVGFLAWNYPRGLIFAGDGGAYFWGCTIAVACIMLVQRHSQVSPWFPMLLLIYPVWETIFSIYRKLARGRSPGLADALHFHQLIYRRIVRGVFDDDESRRMLMRNNRTSPYLWTFTLLSVGPAVLFWRSTPMLMFFCGLFAVTYVVAYLMIVRFKVPRWLRP